jgi:hypothetical protein
VEIIFLVVGLVLIAVVIALIVAELSARRGTEPIQAPMHKSTVVSGITGSSLASAPWAPYSCCSPRTALKGGLPVLGSRTALTVHNSSCIQTCLIC